jgi:hypothetical protein
LLGGKEQSMKKRMAKKQKAKNRQIEEGASRKRKYRKQRLGNTCIVKSGRANIPGRRGRGDLARDVTILDT